MCAGPSCAEASAADQRALHRSFPGIISECQVFRELCRDCVAGPEERRGDAKRATEGRRWGCGKDVWEMLAGRKKHYP